MAKYFEPMIIISPKSHYSLAEYRTLMFSLVSGCPRNRSSFTYNISPGSICSNGSSEPNNENRSSDVKTPLQSNLHVRPPTHNSKNFLKSFPAKIKPTKCPARETKKEARKAKKERRTESEKSKNEVKILRITELRKLTVCIWIRRSRSVRPVNSLMVRFSSL